MLEHKIEENLINKLQDLKYTYRSDIRDLEALEKTSGRNSRRSIESISPIPNLTA